MNPTDTAREMLPCPFCAGEAEMRAWDWPYDRWQVRCSICKAVSSGRKSTYAKALEAWNTRALQHSDSTASIVAWLRQDFQDDYPAARGYELRAFGQRFADAIERGDHLPPSNRDPG